MITAPKIVEEMVDKVDGLLKENFSLDSDDPFQKVYEKLHLRPILRNVLRTEATKLYEAGKNENREKVLKLLVTDFPTAWKVLITNKENHHEKCSWKVAGMLCDCAGQDVFITTINYLKDSLTTPDPKQDNQ